MKAKGWRGWMARYDERPRRERWLMLGVAAGVLLWLVDSFWLGPAWKQWQAGRQHEQRADKALADARSALQRQQQEATVEREQRAAELAQLRKAWQEQEGRPGALDGSRMLAVLEELLLRQGGELKLLALNSVPDPDARPGAAATPASGAGQRLYRHAIELVLSGKYAALHQYLREIAKHDERLRVRSLHFVVKNHPDVEMTLQVETLSPQAAWLTL